MLPSFKGALPFAAVVVSIFAFGGQAWAAGMVSYRAVYDIRLADAKRGSSVSGASGKLAYGVKKTCDGWLVSQTGTMYFQTTVGDVLPQPLTFSSWESGNGTEYRFTSMDDHEGGDVILGAARMPKDGTDGKAEFSKPQTATFKLPQGTMFPVEHTAHILKQAQAGKSQFENTVFEGVNLEGVKLLVTFVSPLSAQAQKAVTRVGSDALKQPGWNFRLAYFDPESKTGEPMYEIEADYLNNGIPVRWLLDYGDFSVEMGMSKLELLPPPKC